MRLPERMNPFIQAGIFGECKRTIRNSLLITLLSPARTIALSLYRNCSIDYRNLNEKGVLFRGLTVFGRFFRSFLPSYHHTIVLSDYRSLNHSLAFLFLKSGISHLFLNASSISSP